MPPGDLDAAIRTELAADLSRRDFLTRAGGLGVGALVLGALPMAARMATPARAQAAPVLTDAALQAFFDTIIPGKKVPGLLTQLGNQIDPKAIAGVDPEHGAVYADALLLDLDFDGREAVCLRGLGFANPTRVVWEAAAAIPFTAFCAAANTKNATSETAAGYAVMGHPGTAPHGYDDFSYRRRLNRGRTRKGYLP